MAGVAVGFGKRLNWPDNYFTFQAQLSYNWYYLKNWEYLSYMNNGTSNSFVLGLSLSRNSIDNPIYTRSGSQFSLDLSITPPVSLFRDKNWQALYEQSQRGSQAAKKRNVQLDRILEIKIQSAHLHAAHRPDRKMDPRAYDPRRHRIARKLQQILEIAV